MRELGLPETSAGHIRVIRRHVTRSGLDTSHFTGQRTWSDARLVQAAPHARTWSALLAALGVKSSSRAYRTRIKAHAVRLGVDLSHLDDQVRDANHLQGPEPALRNL